MYINIPPKNEPAGFINFPGTTPSNFFTNLASDLPPLNNFYNIPESNLGALSNIYSVQLDGIDEYLNGGNIINVDSDEPFTFSFYLKTSQAGFGGLFIKRDSNNVGYATFWDGGNDRLIFILSNTTTTNELWVSSTDTIANNTWVHCIITYDGSKDPSGVNFYVDNILQNKVTVNNTLTGSITHTDPLLIGRNRLGGTALPYAGNIDEPSIWGIEFTLSQRNEIYNNGIPIDVTTLSFYNTIDCLEWWRMGDDPSDDLTGGTGTVIGQVNGNNLTPVNTTSENKVADAP